MGRDVRTPARLATCALLACCVRRCNGARLHRPAAHRFQLLPASSALTPGFRIPSRRWFRTDLRFEICHRDNRIRRAVTTVSNLRAASRCRLPSAVLLITGQCDGLENAETGTQAGWTWTIRYSTQWCPLESPSQLWRGGSYSLGCSGSKITSPSMQQSNRLMGQCLSF